LPGVSHDAYPDDFVRGGTRINGSMPDLRACGPMILSNPVL
jgi:hypothetical protein